MAVPSFNVVESRFGVLPSGEKYGWFSGYPTKEFVDLVWRRSLGEKVVGMFPFAEGFNLPYDIWLDLNIVVASFKVISATFDTSLTLELDLVFTDKKTG